MITMTELKSKLGEADRKLKELYRLSMRSEVSHRKGAILFVDDMIEQASVVKALLEDRGIKIPVLTARSVKEAQHHIQEIGSENIRVVIVDIQLDNSDGRSLINWLDTSHPEIPFIVSTGHAEMVGQLEREFSSTEIFIKGNTLVEEYAEALGLPSRNSTDVIPHDLSFA